MAKGRYRHGATPSAAPWTPPPPSAPPPPPLPPGWDPWAVAGSPPQRNAFGDVAVTLAALALAGLVVVGFVLTFPYVMAHDRQDGSESVTFTDPVVRQAADRACASLEDDLERIPRAPLTAPAARRRAAMDAENVAVARLVDRMRALGQDRLAADPAAGAWVSGWEALVEAREDYAAALGSTEGARFEVLRDIGPIMRPIDDTGCRPPLRLVLLLSEAPAAA